MIFAIAIRRAFRSDMKRKQLSLLLFLQKNALSLFAIFPIALSIFVQSRHIISLIGIRKSLLFLPFVLLFLSPLYFFIYQKSTRQRLEKLQSYAIYWIVGLAFFLRVILIYLLNTTFTSDFEDVYFFARDISIGMPFANLDKYPNIPLSLHLNMPALVLAAVFKVFGASIFVAKSFMVFLGVLSTFLVYVAGQVVSNEKVGIISAYFFALLPSTILYSGTLSGDYLAYPPMLLTIIFYGIFLKSRDGKFAHKLLIFIALGASIGLMDWFRPLGIVLISSVVIATFMSKLGELSTR